MVHPVPRGHHVAAQNSAALRRRRRTHGGHQSSGRAFQEHARPDLLRPGRRGRDADHLHRREVPRGFRKEAGRILQESIGDGLNMAETVKLTINGKEIEATKGALLIEVARQNGIEIPAFCYYENLSLQAACRMCLVEVEKTPKLQVGCTLPVAEGMVVHTESEIVKKARKGTLEFLLTNHPLDCPVCDKGGECELQDMTFRYGMGESRFLEQKLHTDEEQWSPVVFYDRPRCILCYRCVRICDEGMGVKALGVGNRGTLSVIEPNQMDHLECDEC